ncbi:MAG: HAMP domain-containing sensor histidine kinase [Balneolaceae bacterium]
MQLFLPANRIKIILVTLLIVLGTGSYMYNQYLIEKIREQESSSVELWAKAIEFNSQPVHDRVSSNLSGAVRILSGITQVPDSVLYMIEEAELTQSTFDFVTENLVIGDQFQVPSIVVDENEEILFAKFVEDDKLGPALVRQFAALHDPVRIVIGDGPMQQTQYVYYGESQTIQYLRYFPYFQFGLLALLLGIGYTTYNSITRSEQSNLWVGMAKEAAHQLGTPISSLYGWIQLLRDKKPDDKMEESIVGEIENDIHRLQRVAERFNKIGSEPELTEMSLEPIVDQVIDYMENRLPRLEKRVTVKKSVKTDAKVQLNGELFHWALENLIKNSMDAIRENSDGSFLAINVNQLEDEVRIDIIDSGSGIDRRYLNEVFKPGFSTKKRGWGLGLSLTRRIIEDYHKGRIDVLHSDPTGTTMRVTLKTLDNGSRQNDDDRVNS